MQFNSTKNFETFELKPLDRDSNEIQIVTAHQNQEKCYKFKNYNKVFGSDELSSEFAKELPKLDYKLFNSLLELIPNQNHTKSLFQFQRGFEICKISAKKKLPVKVSAFCIIFQLLGNLSVIINA